MDLKSTIELYIGLNGGEKTKKELNNITSLVVRNSKLLKQENKKGFTFGSDSKENTKQKLNENEKFNKWFEDQKMSWDDRSIKQARKYNKKDFEEHVKTFNKKKDFNKWYEDQQASWDDRSLKRTKAREKKESTQQKKELEKQKNIKKQSLRYATRFRGEYMSIMFGGMMLQRTFGGLFKTLISDYKEFTKESVTPLSESLTSLEANWKFLKFAMIDAASPILGAIADWFAGIAKSLSKMDSNTLSGLTYLIGSFAVFGTVLAGIGQGVLFWEGLKSVLKIGKYGELKKVMTGMENLPSATKFGAGTKFLNSIEKAAGIGLIAWSISDMFSGLDKLESGDWLGSIYNAMSAGAKLWGGVELLKGNTAKGGALAIIGVSIDLLEKGTLFQNIASVIGIFAGLGGGIAEVILQMKKKIFNIVEGTFLERVFFGTTLTNPKEINMLKNMKSMSFVDAFKEGFGKSYVYVLETGKEWDDYLTKIREESKIAHEEMGVEAVNFMIDPLKYASGNFFDDFKSKGKNAFEVSLKDSTYDYVTDDKKGFKLLLNNADLFIEKVTTRRRMDIDVYYHKHGSPGGDTGERSLIDFGSTNNVNSNLAGG